MIDRQERWLYYAYILIAASTGIPFFAKRFQSLFYAPWLIYIFLVCGILLLLTKSDTKKFAYLNRFPLWLLGIIFLLVVNFLMYPATRLVENPSTAPNALVEPAIALFQGHHPYSVKLFDGAPISPGPGWILLNLPIFVFNAVFLLTPLHLLISLYFISKFGQWRALGFLVLMLVSVCFFQMSVTGHDLQAFTLATVSLTTAVFLYHRNNIVLLSIAVLTGLVATARLPFAIYPVALSVCLFKIDHREAIKFLVVSLSVLLIMHAFFYMWADIILIFYQPFHVFGRGARSGPLFFQIVAISIWTVSSLWLFFRLNNHLYSWFVFIWGVMFVPFAFVGLGELINNWPISVNSLASWEGKGYAFFTAPLLVAAIVFLRSDSDPRQADGQLIVPPDPFEAQISSRSGSALEATLRRRD